MPTGNSDEITAALTRQRNLDDQVLLMIKRKGCPLSDSHTIDHGFVCDKSKRSELALALQQIGMTIGAETEDDTWLDCTEVASPDSMPERTKQLIRLAAQHQASYDGWGTHSCKRET